MGEKRAPAYKFLQFFFFVNAINDEYECEANIFLGDYIIHENISYVCDATRIYVNISFYSMYRSDMMAITLNSKLHE